MAHATPRHTGRLARTEQGQCSRTGAAGRERAPLSSAQSSLGHQVGAAGGSDAAGKAVCNQRNKTGFSIFTVFAGLAVFAVFTVFAVFAVFAISEVFTAFAVVTVSPVLIVFPLLARFPAFAIFRCLPFL